MNIRLLCIVLAVSAAACSGTKSETADSVILSPAFKNFVDQFPVLQLPLTLSDKETVPVKETALPADAVRQYLGVEQPEAYAVGSITGAGYVALLFSVEYDPMESAIVAVLLDGEGNKKSAVTLYGSTDEVENNFALVEHSVWNGNTITRKIEYHYGNSGDDPSHYAEVVTTVSDDGSLKSTPEKIIPETSTEAQPKTAAFPVEFAAYRSEKLKDAELVAVYPFEDQPHFLIVRNNEARLLSIDNEQDVEGGVSIAYDSEVSALKLSAEREEDSGIIIFKKIDMITKSGEAVSFRPAVTKRSAAIGKKYVHQKGNATGDLEITLKGNELDFFVTTNTGDPDYHVCEVSGNMQFKGNLAYYQGEPFDDQTCKLIFLFIENSVQVITASGNQACGCGANAFLNHTFTKR